MPALEVTQAPPPRKPLYKRWWLWTSVAAVTVGVALGVGLGVGLNAGHGQPVGSLVTF